MLIVVLLFVGSRRRSRRRAEPVSEATGAARQGSPQPGTSGHKAAEEQSPRSTPPESERRKRISPSRFEKVHEQKNAARLLRKARWFSRDFKRQDGGRRPMPSHKAGSG